MSSDFVVSLVALVLTVMTLSYLIGDSPLFRLAVHVFVGVAAGYVAVVAWWQVLWPDLLVPLVRGTAPGRAVLAVPLLLSGLLLMKVWPPLTRLGTPAMGLLVGAASAVAIGGAVQGTLIPQAFATVDAFGSGIFASPDALVNGFLVLGGVVASLAYFQFSAAVRPDGSVGRPAVVEIIAVIGSVFLAITLGVLFAGVYAAALTALMERLHFIGTFLGLG
jgi:hypothetical protein